MYPEYTTCPLNKQASEEQAEKLAHEVEQFLHPLLVCLDLVLDRRLVRTFAQAVMAIIVHRSRSPNWEGCCSLPTTPQRGPNG